MELEKLITFVGRFHPVVVHLPIGFLLMVFLLEIFALKDSFKGFKLVTPIVLMLGIISSILSAAIGYLLSLSGGYDEATLQWHMWLGIGVSVLSIVAYILKKNSLKKETPSLAKVYLILMTSTVVLLMFAGHYGGVLTHGSGYLTEHAPTFSESEVDTSPNGKKQGKKVKNIKEAVFYADIIQPIMDEKCISCHNAEKKKGGLRLDNYAALMKGGDKGAVLVPGKIEQSEFYHRLLLPVENKGKMPPSGKTPLTDKEMEILAWWINEGAPADKKLAELTIPAKIESELKRIMHLGDEKSGIYSLKIAKADENIIAKLKGQGWSITPLAENQQFLNVQTTAIADVFGDREIKMLLPLSQQVTWLDLGKTKITDEALKNVAAMENLTKLYLQNTSITDAGVKQLEKLKYLEYLNLYGTKISDKALQSLAGLKNLKSLFIWQSDMTPAGIEELSKKIPGIQIINGATPFVVPAKQEEIKKS